MQILSTSPIAELSKREDADLDRDAIAHRLKEDVVSSKVYKLFSCIYFILLLMTNKLQLREAGKLQRKVADSVSKIKKIVVQLSYYYHPYTMF